MASSSCAHPRHSRNTQAARMPLRPIHPGWRVAQDAPSVSWEAHHARPVIPRLEPDPALASQGAAQMRRTILTLTAALAGLTLVAAVAIAAPAHRHATQPTARPAAVAAIPPSPGNPSSDADVVSGTTDASGFLSVDFNHDLGGDPDHVDVTIISPSCCRPNLPANVRVTGADSTGFDIRVFGHQLVRDPNGNIRLRVYANLLITISYEASHKKDYCM